MIAMVAICLAGCGSEGSVDADPSNDGGPSTDTPTGPTGPTGDGTSGPTGDGAGGGPGTDQDAGGGTGGDQDSGTTTDSGSGGGDQDGGTTTGDGGSGGGGDQDSGSGGGGGDQDGGVTTDGGSGGDQDSGSGGDQDAGSGGGDQDSGSGGGQDAGSGGGDQDAGDTCHVHSCTYTLGYYSNHTSSVTGLTLGGVSYTQSEVLGFLSVQPKGDDSIILAKQLIAALLNGGACDPNASATVAAAQSWMTTNKDGDGRLPYGTTCVNPSDPGCTAWSLGQTLDQYNQGNAGTPHCQ